MDIVKIQKWSVIGLALLIVLLLDIYLFIKPQAVAVQQLSATQKDNTAKIQELELKKSNNEKIIVDKKYFKYKFNELSQMLPNYLVPENFIKSLKTTIVENRLTVEEISFLKPVEYSTKNNTSQDSKKQEQSSDTNVQASQPNSINDKANKLIKSLFKESESEIIIATDSELQLSNIPDESAFKVEADIPFVGDYIQLKRFIAALENNINATVINSFNLDTGKDGTGQGVISISYFGFKDTKIPVHSSWQAPENMGKNDLFEKFYSRGYNIDDNNISDFDIKLSPITSDVPSVIICKHVDYGTEICADNKGNEEVKLSITEKSGKFYYKYQTQGGMYPRENSIAEFKPVTNDAIIVKVLSKNRVSDADNSGINLIIDNQTKREIKVIPYGDDKERPRLNVIIK